MPLNSPGIASFFHFLHHPLFPSQVSPTERVSGWAYLDGAKHFIENAFSSGALRGPGEEKHVAKAGNLLFGFCTDLLSVSRAALFQLSSPRQAMQMTSQLSAGRGPCAPPQCGAELGAARLSWWHPSEAVFPFLSV